MADNEKETNEQEAIALWKEFGIESATYRIVSGTDGVSDWSWDFVTDNKGGIEDWKMKKLKGYLDNLNLYERRFNQNSEVISFRIRLGTTVTLEKWCEMETLVRTESLPKPEPDVIYKVSRNKKHQPQVRTLIIHPDVASTYFLKPVYDAINYKTIITSNFTKKDLNEEIKRHDRIIMLGHGWSKGLLDMGVFGDEKEDLIIDSDTANLLRDKSNMFIWCNADWYVRKNKLHGFHTGSFIFDENQVPYCGIQGADASMIAESNQSFVRVLSATISGTIEDMRESLIREYGKGAETNPVVKHNVNQFFISDRKKGE